MFVMHYASIQLVVTIKIVYFFLIDCHNFFCYCEEKLIKIIFFLETN